MPMLTMRNKNQMPDPLEVAPAVIQGNPEPFSQKTEQMIHTYRGWDAFEKARGGPDIIDFDLYRPKGEASFSSRREILSALQGLLERHGGATEEDEFLRARLQGSIAYLRALMGQQIDFHEYLRLTLGVVPEPFSSEEIEAARSKAADHLAHFGIEFKAEDKARFDRELVVDDRAAIRRGIVDSGHPRTTCAHCQARRRSRGTYC